ncbi:recombinase family protein [Halomonas sp. CH40]
MNRWFVDEATSRVIKAKNRKELGELLSYVSKGDAVIGYAIDRLGGNTIDVLETVESLNIGFGLEGSRQFPYFYLHPRDRRKRYTVLGKG